MKSAMSGADGFSPRNLRYCQRFYELYKAEENLPQLVAELVRIPRGHHRFVIDKFSVMSSTKSRCLSEFQITN